MDVWEALNVILSEMYNSQSTNCLEISQSILFSQPRKKNITDQNLIPNRYMLQLWRLKAIDIHRLLRGVTVFHGPSHDVINADDILGPPNTKVAQAPTKREHLPRKSMAIKR